ncbi:MAG TPA: carboxypeptidase regulatory-like domain-containing protein [Candidatus Sulfotelmatobacter sp.]|nr:carboxypeptidase regulatory-like domain-containing protein [Candidatus Sulfotelmatobacter sp.]
MRNSRRFLVPVFVVVSMLLLPAVLLADVTGSINGVVRDPSQAVVKGVHVRITNTQTNLSQDTVSADDGSYRFLALPVGTYTLNATLTGFQHFSATDIVLQVNDQLRIDISLKVGNVNEEMTIAADAVQVETESTQLGDVIDSKKMLNLPLNGRSYLDLLGLQAGVAPSGSVTIGGNSGTGARNVSGYLDNAGNVSVNGQRETANAFLVNGGDVSEGRNLGAGLVPNLDSVEEFRLITNSFDAEYGKFSGAVMNAITKSGTNGFHGDVFEFLRNDKMDARNFFTAHKSELRRHQFGGVAGGPFWKDKLFWFTDYQGTRQVRAAETGILNLPPSAEFQGNFGSGILTGAVDGPPPNNTCPTCAGVDWPTRLTQRLGYPVTQGEPYWTTGCNTPQDAQNGVCVFPGGVIPQSAWSSAAVGTLKYIPQPNIDPVLGIYADNSQKDRVTDNKIGERVDFNNRKTGNWSFYYHFDDSTVFSALPSGGATVPGFPAQTPTRAQEFVISNTKTLGPTAVNEARVTFFRTATHLDNPKGGQAALSSLGFVTGTGTQGIIPDALPGFPEYVPQLYFTNFAIGAPSLITFQPNNTYMASDGFSKVAGKHTLKFGGEARYLQVNERNLASQDGAFVFDGTATGSDFADYLLGAPTGAGGGFTQAALQLLDSRTRYGGAYAEDTWRAKPNLTLNLGLRWEVSTPWYDTQGKIQTWVPGEQSVVFPNSPKGLVYPGDPGVPKTLAPTTYKNFGPRVGLAYSPGFSEGALGKIFGGPGKTSIRAAYGIYYTSVEDLNLFYEVADAPFGLYWTSPGSVLFEEPYRNRLDGGTDGEGQRFPFTVPIPGSPANKTLDFSVYEPMSYFPGYDIHNKLPYAEHFNFSIQRELSKSTVLTLAYVGTEGHRLISQSEANPGDATLCLQLAAQGAGCGPNGEQNTYTVGSNTIYGTRDKLLNPNYCPGAQSLCYGFGNTFTKLVANSIYNAAEVTVERRAGDVTLLAAYTFAKALDNASGFNDLVNFANPKLSRGLSSTDVHHNFVVSYMWAIPFDRAFHRLPKRLTQGWQLQGITRFATGFPIQMGQGNPVSGPLCTQVDPNPDPNLRQPLCVGDASMVGSPSTDMPNVVGPIHIQNPRSTPGTFTYFDQSTFVATACNLTYPNGLSSPGVLMGTDCGSFGTANRRFFHGPGFNNTDLGILKRIPVTEAKAFEIRAEFFNVFNHAQFLNPSGDISSGSFGNITNARDPRIGQVSAKFIW